MAEWEDRMRDFKVKLRGMGYRRGFIELKLQGHTGQVLENERLSDMIKMYVDMWMEESRAEPGGTLEDVLYRAGLTKRKASQLKAIIEGLPSYSRNQLLDIAIECARGQYDRITPVGQRHYVQTEVIDEWSPHETFKQVFNASTTRSLKTNHRRVLSSLPDEGTLFYHATNWKSAANIVEHGIDHYRGRPCLDFGLKPGYYMTPDFQVAMQWCEKNSARWQRESCILVFNVRTGALRGRRHKAFKDAGGAWTELVTASRRCGKNELDRCDSVYGPMVANVEAVVTQVEPARPHDIPKFQLASKSNAGDEFFSKCYVGAVFMSA